MAYQIGAEKAFTKFALAPGVGSHLAELAGLGLLAAPVGHDLMHEKPEDKWKSIAEMGGLGLLAGNEAHGLYHLLKH
jgi:hypothetical protein